jgi:hypothetical protein
LADNITLSTNVGSGSVVAADEISAAYYQRIKLVHGADGVNAGDVATGNPLPVVQTGTLNVGTVTTVSAVTTVTTVTTVSTVTAVSDAQVQGKAAHDAAVSGNPVLLGAYAKATAPTDVSTDGDAARLWCDLAGRLQIGDGAGSLTIDNAALSVTGGGVEASALRVTIASDSTGVLSIDDNGGSLTVDAPVGTPVFVRLSDGAAAITTLAVSLASVPSHAVTNAGTFVVQVDGSALTALQLIDDVVYVDDADWTDDTSKHLLVGGLYQSVPQTITDGDVGPFQVTSNGYLIVSVNGTLTVASHAVTNAGTFAVQAAQSGTWNITNVSGTVSLPTGASTAAKQPALGTAGTASADVITVQGVASMTPLLATITFASAQAVTQSGTWNIGTVTAVTTVSTVTAVTTVSTVTTVSAITGGGTAHDAAAAAINPLLCGAYASAAVPSDVSADNDAVRLWALRSGALATQPTYAGVLAVAGNGASGTGVQRVTIANDSTGILAGVTTVTTVTTVSTVTALTTLTGSGIAHDGVDSGNPHKIGAKATTSLSGKTMVVDNDRSDLFCGTDGVLITRPHTNLEDVVQERVTNTDGASTAFAAGLAAPGAGVRLWIAGITIANSSATFCTVDLRDGAAGAVLWTFPVPATGGVTHRFDPPLRLTANTALAYDASAAISTLSISANGFKSKV